MVDEGEQTIHTRCSWIGPGVVVHSSHHHEEHPAVVVGVSEYVDAEMLECFAGDHDIVFQYEAAPFLWSISCGQTRDQGVIEWVVDFIRYTA